MEINVLHLYPATTDKNVQTLFDLNHSYVFTHRNHRHTVIAGVSKARLALRSMSYSILEVLGDEISVLHRGYHRNVNVLDRPSIVIIVSIIKWVH